jgi:hypothetical protein
MARLRGRRRALHDLLAALTARADDNELDWWAASLLALVGFENTEITVSEIDPDSEAAADCAVRDLLEGNP